MDTLRSLGYEYRDGRLTSLKSGEGFKFESQEHYDALAEAVLQYVVELLETEAKLVPLMLPIGAEEGTPCCPVYVSADYDKLGKMLVLIQGSGRVRVGVWGCALCINKDLDQGTMLPYIKKAAAEGYGVVVLNPNLNFVDGKPIPGSETPANHVAYAWDKVVAACLSEGVTVHVIAHSNGGRAFLDMLCAKGAGVAGNVGRLVFTDSYHMHEQVNALPEDGQILLKERAINYVPHSADFGSIVDEWDSLGNHFRREDKGCKCVSAQTQDHAATNHASLEAAFAFLQGTDA